MQEEVKVEREEKAKLAEGVKVLASKSGELTQEIREIAIALERRRDANEPVIHARQMGLYAGPGPVLRPCDQLGAHWIK